MKAKKKNRKKMVRDVKKKIADVVESVKADPFGVGAAARGVGEVLGRGGRAPATAGGTSQPECADYYARGGVSEGVTVTASGAWGVDGAGNAGRGGGGGGGVQGGAWHPGADDTRCTLETHKLLDRLGAKEFPRGQLPERLKHFMQSILASVPSDFREGPNDSHKTVDRLIFALVNSLDTPIAHENCSRVRDELVTRIGVLEAEAVTAQRARDLSNIEAENHREFVRDALAALGMTPADRNESIQDARVRILNMLAGIAATKDELIAITEAEGAEKRETWGWIVRRIRERLEVEKQTLDVSAHARYSVICAIGNLEEEMLVEIAREVSRARAKHPWNGQRWHSLGALTEETGEVARAMNDKEGEERIMAEAVQVAATAIRLAVQK